MTREQKIQIIDSLKTHCNYYEKPYITSNELYDTISCVILKKHAFRFSKTGAILEMVLNQNEVNQCENVIHQMLDKEALIKSKYSFKVANKILNYKEV